MKLLLRFSGLLGAVFTLLTAPARAQAPPALLGRWEARTIGFVTTPAMPDSVRELLDDPQVADLNRAMTEGSAHLVVEFRPDGTYRFTITRDEQLLRDETGTYSLAGNRLLGRSPGSPDGSSFHDQQVRELGRRTLTLAFLVGPELPGVEEEIAYRRVGR